MYVCTIPYCCMHTLYVLYRWCIVLLYIILFCTIYYLSEATRDDHSLEDNLGLFDVLDFIVH